MLKRVFSVLFIGLFTTSCIMVPAREEYVDEECDVIKQRYVLKKTDKAYISKRERCDDGCLEALLESIFEDVLLTSMSAVVSGSIVLAGNSILWLEQHGDCEAYEKRKSNSASDSNGK